MGNPKKKFAKLYDKYVEKIYRYIFLKVGSSETAEDLTSQVFTKAWKRISKIKNHPAESGTQIKNIPAYLYQIARAEIANYYRERGKFQTIHAITDQIVDPNPSLEEKSKLGSDLEILKKSLAELQDDYQNVVIWRYLDGYSIKDIAEIMEKPEGTVRVMIHRALKELREKIEKICNKRGNFSS